MEQNADILADQPAEALIGKCVRVFVTEAQKWHISGKIIDASPQPERAPVDYFERLEAQRKAELMRQFQADEDALANAIAEKRKQAGLPADGSMSGLSGKFQPLQYIFGMIM